MGKVIDKTASITLVGRKLINCGRSDTWCDEELRQLVGDRRDCFAKRFNRDNNWNEYLKYVRN